MWYEYTKEEWLDFCGKIRGVSSDATNGARQGRGSSEIGG
jgi:hypothetical protein